MTFKITPSGRIDYCSQCKQEHGYDCPLDTQPNQPDSVEELVENIARRDGYEETEIAILIDTLSEPAFQEAIQTLITQAKAEERARVTEEIRRDLQAEAQRELKDFEAVIKFLQDNQPLP